MKPRCRDGIDGGGGCQKWSVGDSAGRPIWGPNDNHCQAQPAGAGDGQNRTAHGLAQEM